MKCCRRFLRSFTWLAWCAMVGLALAPTVSHALARAGAAAGSLHPWSELCSTAAAKPVASSAAAVGDDGGAPSQARPTLLDHCPLCGAAGPALAPPAAAALPAFDGAPAAPRLSAARAPRPLFAWAAAQPRGPPAAS